MAWFPRLEFTRSIFAAGGAQFRDDPGILRRKPVLQLVERFHRGEYRRRDFNGVRFHELSLPFFVGPLKPYLPRRGCGEGEEWF